MKKIKSIIATNEYGSYYIPNEINYTYTAQAIIKGNVHEKSTIDYIKSISCNIIHAGTGFGDFLPALKDCDNIFTFEPNNLMYISSLETIKLNKLTNVKIYPYSIGNYDGENNLKHIDDLGQEMGPRSEIGNGISVKQVKLDTIIPKSVKIDLIHLDLEGYEFEALKGAKEIIERDKPIIVLEIDTRAVNYNNFMESINYYPIKQLVYNYDEKMVFINTVYKHSELI